MRYDLNNTLIAEISKLIKHLQNQEESDVNDITLGKLTKLKEVVKEKGGNKIYRILKLISSEVYDVAKQIGCLVIASNIRINS